MFKLVKLFIFFLFVKLVDNFDITIETKFKNWQKKYKVIVTNYTKYLEIFKKNDDIINYYNNLYPNLLLEHNKHSLNIFQPNSIINNTILNIPNDLAYCDILSNCNTANCMCFFPETINWINSNVITNVSSQNGCGSCWIFATVSAIESAYAIKYGKLLKMSTQQILDCNDLYDCNGGTVETVYKWIRSNGGVCLDSDYAYVSKKNLCNNNCTVIPHTGSVDYRSLKSSELSLTLALTKKPVVASIYISNPIFLFYRSGVIDIDCTHVPNHSVLVVGYTNDYYIVKNSWSVDFGINGYMFIKRNTNYRYGSACIAYKLTYPVF